jgi:hypothetical protein
VGVEGTGFELQSPPVGYYTLQEGGDVDQVCREDRPQGESRFLCPAAAARLGRSSRAFGRSLPRSFFLPLHRADGVAGLGGPVFPVPSFSVPARPSNG